MSCTYYKCLIIIKSIGFYIYLQVLAIIKYVTKNVSGIQWYNRTKYTVTAYLLTRYSITHSAPTLQRASFSFSASSLGISAFTTVGALSTNFFAYAINFIIKKYYTLNLK